MSFRSRLARAVERRLGYVEEDPRLAPGLAPVRLVDGPGDDLEGLVVEAYGPCLRVESFDERWRPERARVAEEVARRWPRVRGAAGAHRPRGGEASSTDLLWGEVPAGLVVEEAGVRYLVRLLDDAVGAGLFLDQREGRARIKSRAAGGPSLNLFAHAGGFGAAAALGGASRVDQVDAAKKCAPWAALNLALNGQDPRQHRFLVEDVFKVLRRAARRGPTYQTLVCDPPTTARRPKGGRFVAKDELPDLAASCLQALLPGGELLLSCNDRRLRPEAFEQAVRQASVMVGRSIASLEPLSLGADFTATGPGQRSTQGVLVSVL